MTGTMTSPDPKNHAIVLRYTSISDDGKEGSVSPVIFEQQLAYLNNSGKKVVWLQDIAVTIRWNEPITDMVAITFDGGLRSFYSTAFPLLKKYGFRSALFVIIDRVGREIDGEQYCSFDELCDLRDSGLVDIGSNTDTFARLTELNEDDQRQELLRSKRRIDAEVYTTNPNIHTLIAAYPYGAYSETTMQQLEQTLYTVGVTLDPRTVLPNEDPRQLPRFCIDRNTSMERFKEIVMG